MQPSTHLWNKIALLNTNEIFADRYQRECERVNNFMVWLMIGQWIAGIAFSLFYSPFTWIGQTYALHVHVWAAILLGGSISGFAILWVRTFPKASHSRHVMAICQVLWSALLIHLSGGRIETHFHVFASLAILSIYRDWRVLVTATAVVAIDHAARGIFYPLSAFGIINASPFRWIEHAAWVLFEVSFLAPGCVMLRNEIYELCVQQTKLTEAKVTVDRKVEQRTSELVAANEMLAAKTREAEKLALVARYTDNCVIITDEQAHIEWVNEGFERITGYSSEEALGYTPYALLDGPETNPKQVAKMQNAIASKEGYDLEMIRYRKNGDPFWMAIESRPIHDDDGNVTQFILVESDITARIEAELERQKLNEQLIEASRTAGIAEVATGVLHNVGNVLNSVNVSAAVIGRQIHESAFEKLERVSVLIQENIENFADFVDHDSRGKQIPSYILKVTDVLKKERGKIINEFEDLLNNVEHIKSIVSVQQSMAKSKGLRQRLCVNEIVDDAITANKGTLSNHKVDVCKHISTDLPEFVSDKRKLLQILINLIHNAKDALVESQETNPKIDIHVLQVDGNLELEVCDNGLGIAAENLSRIFQHGFTTKKTGHGFGLHFSANVATELGGSLVAYSDGLGLGTTFRLTLPFNDTQLKSTDAQASMATGLLL